MSIPVNLAFTLRQARAIQNDFQYLVGSSFYNDADTPAPVECLAIAPFDDVNKWIFIQNYRESQCINKAISYYHAPFYDVLVIGPISKDREAYIYTDIRSYLKNHNIQFDIGQYTAQ